MIDQLVAALGQDLGLTSKEIADAVWLALQIDAPGLPVRAEDGGAAAGAKREGDRSQSSNRDFSNSDLDSRRDEGPQEPKPPEAELRTPDSDAEGQDGLGSDLMIKVPDARSLREPLELAKSLKPLLQKVTAGLSTVLDEAATVERIAGEGIWMPVLKPNLEPWLDLALVVDDSLSMHLWQRTIAELQRLLGNYGVFRDVRVWSLATDDLGQVRLRPRSGGKAAQEKTLHRPSELVDPGGRRLILIATDCVSEIWHDGTMLPALKLWAASGPMAIVQMLPEWLWARTALGFASAVRLHSLMPGVPNQRLDLRGLSPWDEVDLEAGIRVPVVTLEPEPFLAWAKVVSSKQGAWCPGFIFEPEGAIGASQFEGLVAEESAEQRVQRFRATASPMARRLAGLLAAAPVISLPIVRIIRDRLLPESRQVHVAEVFLGGLLKPGSPLQLSTHTDAVQYAFLDGVRAFLLESSPAEDSLDVLNAVSEFVSSRLGLSITEFTAVLKKSGDIKDQKLTSQSQSFSKITAQILKRLGGEYSSFALQLENSLQALEPSVKNDSVIKELTSYAYEANLVILGEGQVGKTFLALKIFNFDHILKKDSTSGIIAKQWRFRFNDKDFRVNIKDIESQEIYYSTYQFFLTKRALYIVVVDPRNDNIDLDYWLSVVELLSDSSPVIVVKNEKQDRDCQINEYILHEKFSNLKEALAVNLATDRGLPNLVEKIKHYISRLENVGNPLPSRWIKVRQALDGDSRSYIPLSSFFKICESNGLRERDEQLLLSSYLHDLGICLHFQDDLTLRRIFILNPKWVSLAIHRVFENRKIRENQGYFSKLQLRQIWNDRQYAYVRDELLQIMIRFKLCYEISTRPETYIVPSLLSDKQPNYSWNSTQNLILHYEYEFMPRGVMTQFIVEMRSWIEEQALVWRGGVVLLKDGARAEVVKHYKQKRIRVRVSGQKKKELLGAITNKINRIHASYERLQYKTLISCNCSDCIDSRHPEFYSIDALKRRMEREANQFECPRSSEMIDVRFLISSELISSNLSTATREQIPIACDDQDSKWGTTVAQSDDAKSQLEQQILQQDVKEEFRIYLAQTLGDRAVEWLQLNLQGYTQKEIAQQMQLPLNQVYRLREKVSYHATRIFGTKRKSELARTWLGTSLIKEHNFGLTLGQWQQFWNQLTPDQQSILSELKADKELGVVAQERGLTTNQILSEWNNLYRKAQDFRIV